MIDIITLLIRSGLLSLVVMLGLTSRVTAMDFFDSAKQFANNIPVVGTATSVVDLITGNSLDDKVDRIENRQKTSLDRIREVAFSALETKRRIEDIYYFTKWGIDEAQALAEGLKEGKIGNFLGALLEQGLGIPINPAEYIPDIPEAAELRRNLDWDLGTERTWLHRSDYFLSGTRSALMCTGLFEKNPKRFEADYERSIVYEKRLKQAIHAKSMAMLKVYKAEAERLKKEIRLLERSKERKGLKVGDVIQIEQTIDDKRRELLELSNQIDCQLANNLTLSDEDYFNLSVYKANRDTNLLDKELEKDRKRMRAMNGKIDG